jgi:hypothetical protein
MRNTFILFIALLATVPVLAQDKTFNDPNAERRNVSGFHAISTANGIDLYITQGNEEVVAVSANKTEYRDKIRTEVENGVLKIYYESKSYGYTSWGWNNKKLKAYISVRKLDGIRASGGADVVINGTLTSDKLNIGLSGGSDFKGAVNASTLDVTATGGSDVNISGRAGFLKISATGGSDFKGYDLIAETCDASCSGGSDINITVNKELVAAASGGSDIYYRGNAAVKKTSSSGGSSVTKRG